MKVIVFYINSVIVLLTLWIVFYSIELRKKEIDAHISNIIKLEKIVSKYTAKLNTLWTMDSLLNDSTFKDYTVLKSILVTEVTKESKEKLNLNKIGFYHKFTTNLSDQESKCSDKICISDVEFEIDIETLAKSISVKKLFKIYSGQYVRILNSAINFTLQDLQTKETFKLKLLPFEFKKRKNNKDFSVDFISEEIANYGKVVVSFEKDNKTLEWQYPAQCSFMGKFYVNIYKNNDYFGGASITLPLYLKSYEQHEIPEERQKYIYSLDL